MLPTLFISHGSPMLSLTPSPARDALAALPATLPEPPRAILVASAHWERASTALTGSAHPPTIHDFGGFPKALYDIEYPAPGAPDVAARAVALLAAAGIAATVDPARGLDHGAWVPLMVAWPEARVPVLQVSLQSHAGPARQVELGRALAPLRAQGVLVVGSGSWTHDLGRYRGQPIDTAAAADVDAFGDWMAGAVLRGDVAALVDYRAQAPNAVENHPTEEHLLPLFVAMGAAGGVPGRQIHRSTQYGVLRMDAYAFD